MDMDATPRHKRRLKLTVSSSPQSLSVVLDSTTPGVFQLLHVFVAGGNATLWYHNCEKKCMKEAMRVWIEKEDRSVVPGRKSYLLFLRFLSSVVCDLFG